MLWILHLLLLVICRCTIVVMPRRMSSNMSTISSTVCFCLFVLLRALGFFPVLAGAAVVANPAKLGPFFERLYQARNSLRELRFSATASTCSQILVDRWMHDLSQEIDPPLPGVPA